MSVKQIKWHAAVLTAVVIAVFAALFALATVTSNADTSYDPETCTYTMTGGTYEKQIELEESTSTTMVISGKNKLTYKGMCIFGTGDLTIIGDGTLEVSNGTVSCNTLTVGGGAKLILDQSCNVETLRSITVDNADIEVTSAYIHGGTNYGDPSTHVFNNANLKFTNPQQTYYYLTELTLGGRSVFTDCNATFEGASLNVHLDELVIEGGTYNFDQYALYQSQSIVASLRAIIKNAVIKVNTPCNFQNLEMKDSSFESSVQPYPYGVLQSPAIWGDNLIFVGSKINIDGDALAGIVGIQQLVMTANTEANVSGLYFGVTGKSVKINHSSGKFQATDPSEATAALSANSIDFHDGSVGPGEFTFESVDVKEPAGYKIAELRTSVKPMTISSGTEAAIRTIMDGNNPAKVVVLEASHNWDAGKVTKQPTTSEDGVKTYTCSICGGTKTEAIPKLAPQDSQAPAAGTDGTPFGKGASVAAAEAAILALPNDNDPAGTAFGLLQLKASKVTKNSVKLTWKAVPGATKYILFANKCGTGNKYKKLGEVTGTSYTATQAAGAALKKGTYYKFMMIAADSSGKVISTSKTVHAATKGGKIGNHKKVTVKKSVTKKAKKLKVGKTLKLKAKAVPQAKKLKVRKHRGIMYETSNPAVAQVNSKGTVKGVGKGTCYIYAYAQNGTCAKVKVTVK